MSYILIVDGSKEYGTSKGLLNKTLVTVAKETLLGFGHNVITTAIDEGYAVEEEVEKYVLADLIIIQMPGWWLGAPWIVKKYIDEVFSAGHGTLYKDDGRTRSDLSKKYGSGGLLKGKKYLISSTWNAPLESFVEPGQFFDGKGADGVFTNIHKAHQFLGMEPLPSFACNDVIKSPHIDQDITRYRDHLAEVIALI